jgi:hypothetical protein
VYNIIFEGIYGDILLRNLKIEIFNSMCIILLSNNKVSEVFFL